jgi:hypothetical protein
MKLIIFTLFVILSVESTSGMGRKATPKPSQKVTLSKTFPTLEVSRTGLIKDGEAGIYVTSIINHTKNEKKHLQRALKKVREVLASSCFETKMTSRKLRKTNGLTNAEVITDLRSKAVEVEFEMYSKWLSKVKGYTYPSTNRIWTNRKFHNGSTDCNKGSNLLHEISHKMGYGHSFKPNKLRPYSVPYSLNWVMKECCK